MNNYWTSFVIGFVLAIVVGTRPGLLYELFISLPLAEGLTVLLMWTALTPALVQLAGFVGNDDFFDHRAAWLSIRLLIKAFLV